MDGERGLPLKATPKATRQNTDENRWGADSLRGWTSKKLNFKQKKKMCIYSQFCQFTGDANDRGIGGKGMAVPGNQKICWHLCQVQGVA